MRRLIFIGDFVEFFGQMHFPTPDTGYTVYLGTDTRAPLKSVDGGNTWFKLDTNITSNLGLCYFTDANTGYIGGGYGFVFSKTIDGGTTWFNASGIIDGGGSMHFSSNTIGYIIGTKNYKRGIYKTIDSGNSWVKQDTCSNLSSVSFVNDSVGYIVGSNGLILKTINGGGSIISTSISPINNQQSEIKVFPNPASAQIFIQGNFPLPATIVLYDITGRKVLSKPITDYRLPVTISTLSQGIYFYQLITPDFQLHRGKIVMEE